MGLNAILVISGALCMFLSGFTFYKTVPREGKPDSTWTNTELRATSVAMLILILLFTGASLVLKGVLA